MRRLLPIPTRSNAYRYAAAILLALAAQIVRFPLHPSASLPYGTYAPFIVVSALVGGLGPGLVTTILCVLEIFGFTPPPVGSWDVAREGRWLGIGALLLTGVAASALSERSKRSREELARANRRTIKLLESLSDGFFFLDRAWRCTYVNAAASKMAGKAPEDLLGNSLWEFWPEAWNSTFGEAYRRAVAGNITVRLEAFYAAPLNAWFDVRCYPSPEGLSLFFTDTTERRRAEERLRLLESAVLQTYDGILILQVSGQDAGGQLPIFFNPALERMTGFDLQDLQAGALAVPRASEANLLRPARLEQPVRRKDGLEFWAEWSFAALLGQDGQPTHFVWTCRDISERKRAEEESELLRSVVESSDDSIISQNLDGTILSWNKGAERIYGYTSEEIVGRSISTLIPPDLAFELLLQIDDLRRGARTERYETERLRKDGTRIFVSLTTSPIKDAQGRIVGASVMGRNNTENKRAQKAVLLSEQRYRSLSLATSQIVWMMSPQGEIVEDVPMWREFTFQTKEEVKGRGWIEAVHPDDRARTADLWGRSIRSRSFHESEFRLRRHDGEYRHMAVHGVPVLEQDGTIREWVGTCADITERIEAEEEVRTLNEQLERRVIERTAELQAANQELEAFAYSVSHDLRAPLRAVDGFSRILLEEFGPQLPAEAQHYLQVARKNAVHMGDLIDGLLAFSHLGRKALHKKVLAPGDLVRQALESFGMEKMERQVEISLGYLPDGEGDPLLLKQVFVNLISNALKYTRTRQVARIEVASADNAVYYVRDNGVGFDMRYANKLFGVFQRLHRDEEYEGTGVGLAIVQRIIHRHGGRVWAESLLDQGATFYFTLGHSAEATAPHDEAAMQPAGETRS